MTLENGTIAVSVLYPGDEGSTFDMDYYVATHMPMAERAWSPHGMLSFSVIDAPGPPGGTLYRVHSLIIFKATGADGMEGLNAAMTSDAGKELTADVANFTNRAPQVVVGKVIAGNKL